jgi:hypothetical protein
MLREIFLQEGQAPQGVTPDTEEVQFSAQANQRAVVLRPTPGGPPKMSDWGSWLRETKLLRMPRTLSWPDG